MNELNRIANNLYKSTGHGYTVEEFARICYKLKHPFAVLTFIWGGFSMDDLERIRVE